MDFASGSMLWFAFKKLYLCSDEQLTGLYLVRTRRCDLLSKNCIFVLTNNGVLFAPIYEIVVICFQKIVSLFWRTTLKPKRHKRISCDLLSKNCIFVLTNNKKFNMPPVPIVVICFQKIVSLFWRTTRKLRAYDGYWLWFAFKKLYLCSDEQPWMLTIRVPNCCDLLSKNCIFVLTNNHFIQIYNQEIVVICFQKIVSLFWRTTDTFKDVVEH